MRIEFFVPGDAKTSGSKRAFLNKSTGKLIVAPANSKQKDWQAALGYFADIAARNYGLITEPCILACVFYRLRPKNHFRTNGQVKPQFENAKPASKPDGLKLCRAVEDAMSKIVYADDSLVCDHRISKRYCENGQRPGVSITVETYDNQKLKGTDNGKEEKPERAGSTNLFGTGRADGST